MLSYARCIPDDVVNGRSGVGVGVSFSAFYLGCGIVLVLLLLLVLLGRSFPIWDFQCVFGCFSL